MVHLTLFGPPQLACDGRVIPLPVRKTLALVVYLAIEGRTSRARLAELFWGGLDETRARRNLRHALHRLRGSELHELVITDDDTVALSGLSDDLHAFEAAVASGRLAEAFERRQGSLCEGMDLDDAPLFTEWLENRRARSTQSWRGAMSRHAAALEAEGLFRAALGVHLRMLEDDCLQEATYRDLMRLHDALGERAAALEAFARCNTTLRAELGLDPLPETCLLAERIRARQTQAAGSAAASTRSALPGSDGFKGRSVPLVARDRELATLAATDVAVVLIEGEAGVGKTRLAMEVAGVRDQEEPSSSARTLSPLRFTLISSSTPFHAVADFLRSAAAGERLSDLAPAWRRDIASLLPELDLSAASELGPRTPPPAETHTRLLEALAQALVLSAGPGRMLVFDDLQWADASSLELLVHLARRGRQSPALRARVFATARSDELAENAAALAALSTLTADGNLSRMTLSAFDEWSMLQLVQRLSGKAGGVRFATRIAGATGGNVFFALETIRALFESGELRVDSQEGWTTRYDDTTTDYAELPLPSSVVEAVRLRVSRLGAAAQRVLETLSLAEDGTTLAEFKSATALTEWEALAGVERAAAAHVVEASGLGYRFAHDLFRTAIRSSLSPDRQRLTHGKLAAALEPLRVAPARVAVHWQEAGQSELAVQAWIRAAEAATSVHAYREAVDHYGRATALLADDDPRAFELLDVRLGHMYMAGLADGRQALVDRLLSLGERLGNPTLQFRALVRAGEIAIVERHMTLAAGYISRALDEFEPPDTHRQLEALACSAFLAGFLDRPEEAFAGYVRAYDIAERSEPRAAGTLAAAAAMAAIRLDRLDGVTELCDAALLASASSPYPIARAQVLSYRSFVWRALGERARSLADLEEAVAIARKLQMNAYLPVYLANLCQALVEDGQTEAADAARRAFEQASTDEGKPLDRYLAAFSAAPVYALQGAIGPAIAAARAAIEQTFTMDHLPAKRESRLLCAAYLMQIGSMGEAMQLVDEAASFVLLGWSRPMLAIENLRATAELSTDPGRARERLQRALIAPFADRVLQPQLEAARILIGRCELALNRPDAALEAVRKIRYSVALESEALALRLDAARSLGLVDPPQLAAALDFLDSNRAPPLHALTLMRAVAAAVAARRGDGKRRDAGWQSRMQSAAQALADSLRTMPPLQSAFIRKHRDLLT